MEKTKLFLLFEPGIQSVIDENEVSIKELLQSKGIDETFTTEVLPIHSPNGERSKDLVPLILASGGSLFAIIIAISQLLKSIYRKPYLIEYDEIVEIKDENGRLILDSWGNPQFKLVKRHELIEPREEDADRAFEINWNSQNGFVLKFGSAEKQIESSKNPANK